MKNKKILITVLVFSTLGLLSCANQTNKQEDVEEEETQELDHLFTLKVSVDAQDGAQASWLTILPETEGGIVPVIGDNALNAKDGDVKFKYKLEDGHEGFNAEGNFEFEYAEGISYDEENIVSQFLMDARGDAYYGIPSRIRTSDGNIYIAKDFVLAWLGVEMYDGGHSSLMPTKYIKNPNTINIRINITEGGGG